MEMALDSSILSRPKFINGSKSLSFLHCSSRIRLPTRNFPQNNRYTFRLASNSDEFRSFSSKGNELCIKRACLRPMGKRGETLSSENGSSVSGSELGSSYGFFRGIVKRGVVLVAMVCGVLVYGCKRVFAVEGVVNAGYGVIGQSILLLRNTWPKTAVFQVFKEQGIVLALLLGLSAFFSMAETSITTLWPWKVQELAEKESEDGVFKMPRSDVNHFLTTY